ncbi:hypothetical protein PROFUN_13758 [Planoprotostelium fungivorum]|uniref:F-box domain-containing protein n=1 Tax=Planoprotostelium fungivorum TaxID=1890364 RepID=A0A2P6N350_9EUKA|nr:hypothetical protein PROFUN_13758 [Planoprotostelium fungivorum]
MSWIEFEDGDTSSNTIADFGETMGAAIDVDLRRIDNGSAGRIPNHSITQVYSFDEPLDRNELKKLTENEVCNDNQQPFSHLNIDVVMEIFSLLSYTDLAAAASVSRTFYSYANHPVLPQWRHLRLFPHRRTITDQILLQIVRKCTLIKSLSLKYCKRINTAAIVGRLIDDDDFRLNLQHLDLSGNSMEEDKLVEFTKKLLTQCPNMNLIDFSWTELKKAENIQNLLLHESKRQKAARAVDSNYKGRETPLALRFTSNLHVKSGQRMLSEMNVRIEFMERRDNSLKVKFNLSPYREDNAADMLPRLNLHSGLKAKTALPLWKVSMFVCTRLELGESVEKTFPEDCIELYYNNTPLPNIYHMSLSSIVESAVHHAGEDIYLSYRSIDLQRRKTYPRYFCDMCLTPVEGDDVEHRRGCLAVFHHRALRMKGGVIDFAQEIEVLPKSGEPSMSCGLYCVRRKDAQGTETEYLYASHNSALNYQTLGVPEEDRNWIPCHSTILSISFHPSGERCVIVSREADVIVCHLNASHQTIHYNSGPHAYLETPFYVAWLPESSSKFLVVFANGTMLIYDIRLNTSPARSKSSDTKKPAPCVSSARRDNNPTSLWRLSSKKLFACSLSRQGILAVVSEELLSVFDVGRELLIHQEPLKKVVLCVQWSHDGRYLLMGGHGLLMLWCKMSKTVVDSRKICRETSNVTCIQQDLYTSNDDELSFACTLTDGFLYFFTVSNHKIHLGHLSDKSRTGRGPPCSIAFGKTMVALGFYGGEVTLWSRECDHIASQVQPLRNLALRAVTQKFDVLDFEKVKDGRLANEIIREQAPHLLAQTDSGLLRSKHKENKCFRCGCSLTRFLRSKFLCSLCDNLICGSCTRATSFGHVCNRCSPLINRAIPFSTPNYQNYD